MASKVVPLMAEIGTELCRIKLEGSLLGGYKCEILTENLSEREVNTYRCPRCEGIMKDGSISNKGEQSCVYCLRQGEQSHFNAPVRSTILSLKCSCPLLKRGCDWLGTLETVESHLTTCGHVYASCELCGVVSTRHEMKNHSQKCSQREACLHCSVWHRACEMAEHVNFCGKVAVLCELGCGTSIRRESTLYHKENECPEEIVICPYEKYRCQVAELKRRELEQHLKESKIAHLELKLDAFAEENNLLKKENQMLRSQLETKDTEIGSLKEAFAVRVGIIHWCIKNIKTCFKPNKGTAYSGRFTFGGYLYQLCCKSDAQNFKVCFYPLQGKNHQFLEWPLKAIFTTKVICYKDTKRSLIITSPMIVIQKSDCGIMFANAIPIASIPLSTDLKDLVRSDCLDVEVSIRIVKNG